MYIFLHIPVTGRIFPATARKPVGPLPMHSTSAGDEDLARRGHLQRRGTTFPVVLVHSSTERRDKGGPNPSRILRKRRWFAFGGAPWVWEPSAPRGKSVGITGFDTLAIFCSFCINVYFCVYHLRSTAFIYLIWSLLR